MHWNVQAVTITKMQGAKMRGQPTTIGMTDLKRIYYATRTTMLEWQLTVLCEPCHVRRYGGISFEIRRSMRGSVAISLLDIDKC